MGDLSANFSTHEFRCHCGCGGAIVQPSLIRALEDVRHIVQTPITVVSGYRCHDHNTKVGGAKNSYHCQGLAADIKAADMAELYKAAVSVGSIKGIGIYLRDNGWLHVDTRQSEARWAQDGLKRPIDFHTAVGILFERQWAGGPKGEKNG